MSDYDVIIIGTRRRRRHARPPPRAVRASASCCSSAATGCRASRRTGTAQDVFVDNRYVSPDTWYDEHGKPFQPQVHYFVGGATKLYGAALYRLREEDFGELAAPRRHLARLADLLRRDRAVLHAGRAALRGARRPRRGPDRAARRARRTRSRPCRTSRASSSSPTTSRPPGYHPFHAPCGIMLDEANMPYSDLRALRELRRLPVPRARQVGRRGARRPTGARAPNVTLLTNAEASQARDERGGHGRHRASSSSTTASGGRFTGDIVVVSCGAANTAAAAARVGERRSTRTASPTAPTRSAATTCSTTARPCSRSRARRTRPSTRRRSGSTTSTSAATTSTTRSATSRWSASPGADVPRREAGRDEARARVDARADRAARDRLLALDRGPAAAGEPRHARRRRHASRSATRRPTTMPKERLYASSSRCSGQLDMNHGPPDPRASPT